MKGSRFRVETQQANNRFSSPLSLGSYIRPETSKGFGHACSRLLTSHSIPHFPTTDLTWPDRPPSITSSPSPGPPGVQIHPADTTSPSRPIRHRLRLRLRLRRRAMDPFHHLNTSFSNPYHPLLSPSPPHHPHFPPLPPLPDPPHHQLPSASAASSAAAATSLERDRLPQWSHAETAAFLAVRADLDHSFLTTKRNKALWEAVSARLHAQGFARTPDQCKSKWKNLVTRFKGTEAAAAAAAAAGVVDPASASAAQSRPQFPFHDEVRRIFDARAERAQALERKRAKGKGVRDRDDEGAGEGEDVDEEDEDDEIEADAAEAAVGGDEELPVDASRSGGGGGGGTKKRRRKQQQQAARAARVAADQGEVEAMLREFMRRQAEMEERWVEAAEAREAERRAREEEWRAAMVALGEERLALVRRWREREDAWRARAEEREERRHQLVAALLAKLGGGGGGGDSWWLMSRASVAMHASIDPSAVARDATSSVQNPPAHRYGPNPSTPYSLILIVMSSSSSVRSVQPKLAIYIYTSMHWSSASNSVDLLLII